jgi:xanthine/CO dehydrogenase XdhC/CoxF family maturation factor
MAIIDQILRAYREGDDQFAVLGTVVDLQGSGYRQPGARLLIDDQGCYIGAISGGCLEKDAARHARRWVADGPQTVLFDTRAKQFHPLGAYGTGCEGVVHLFLQALPTPEPSLCPLDFISDVRGSGRDGILVTAYGSDAYPGTLGTVACASGENVQWSEGFDEHLRPEVIEAIRSGLEDRKTRGVRLDVDGHELQLLVEYLRPPVELVVLGTGRDAAALVEVASSLNWKLRVVGRDPAALRNDAFASVETVLLEEITAEKLAISEHSYVVQMTHDLELDAQLLPHLLDSEAAYLGLLGPRRRTARLLSEIYASGRLGSHPEIDDVLERLATPVGLDLGGEDPYEVAVSIVAEVVAAKNGRSGGSLSDRQGAIHDPHEIIATREEAS